MPNPTPGAKMTPLELNMIAQATGQVPSFTKGAWFGPGEPMQTQAPEEVKGRAFDFPFAVNTNPRPRAEAGENAIDFDTLRRVSDPTQGGLDLLRLAIETVKDEMARQKWTIKGKDGKDGGDEAKKIRDLLEEPDGVNDFLAWQRLVMDDHLVIDQPTIYFRQTSKGFKIPEVIDGGTIKRILAQNGRTPLPPLPAYAQRIKGLPAVDYTIEELLVKAANPRTHRIYGMSPTEQVVNIVNISLRRQLSQLEFYTEGTIPDGLLVGPAGLNPDQLQAFQDNFDAVLSGQTGARRHGRWVPNGTEYIATKAPDITGAVDEWFARVICWCFSLPPNALLKEVNRATAEVNKNTSQEQGLEARKLWFKSLMNQVIRRAYGAKNVVFDFENGEITDPLVKMQVWTGYKSAGFITADEGRDKALGMDPMTPEQKDEVAPPPPPMLAGIGLGGPDKPGKPGGPGTPPGKGDGSASTPSPVKPKEGEPAPKEEPPSKAEKVEKKKPRRRGLLPIDRERASVTRAAGRIRKAVLAYLQHQAKALAKIVKDGAEKVAKADINRLWELWEQLDDSAKAKLAEDLRQELEDLGLDGVEEGRLQLATFMSSDLSDEELSAMLSQANERAVAFAEERASELVGMRKVDGEWIPNPNAEWQIDDTTREAINAVVTTATEEGWSNDQLADAILESTTFDESRADMVARTETAFADVAGNMAYYRETGIVEQKAWIAGGGECDECAALEDLGPIPIDEDFPGEADGPPLHPNCRCNIIPVLAALEAVGP